MKVLPAYDERYSNFSFASQCVKTAIHPLFTFIHGMLCIYLDLATIDVIKGLV